MEELREMLEESIKHFGTDDIVTVMLSQRINTWLRSN